MAKMMLLAGAVLASFLAVKIFFVIQFSKDISMEPVISKGSVAVLSRWSDPKKGDIVLVRLPQNKSRAFFSRVVALGGDKVEILDKKISNAAKLTQLTAMHPEEGIVGAVGEILTAIE